MVRSRSAALRFWRWPWKRRLFDLGAERLFPWACLGCGVVLLYMERLPVLSEEADTARARSVAREAQPAHFKS
ncbi:MAG TPA: hypothetical protein VJ776_02425 [Thermoanaerobaculia bacterium]|nr:hypothetical protein [Thermoanaerobaculia bacterium]